MVGQAAALKPFVSELRRRRHPGRVVHRSGSEADRCRARGRSRLPIELHTGTYCEAAAEGKGPSLHRELARLRDGARQGGRRSGLEVHAGHGLDFDNVGDLAADPRDCRAEYRSLPGWRGAIRRPRRERAAHARHHGPSESCLAAKRHGSFGERRRAMIIGLGNDIIDIRRMERTIERFGDRFLSRVFTDTERRKSDWPGGPRRLLRQALRRQRGLRQGFGHRLPARSVLARYGRRQSALRPADA